MSNRIARELGVVSNCWKVQLDDGQSLDALIGEAVDRGYRAIELRQGCLGEYEIAFRDAPGSESARNQIARLSQRFPGTRFNLAVSLPCFDSQFRDDDRLFSGAVAASVVLAQQGGPHLRLVDAHTRQLSPESLANVTERIVRMTMSLVEVGGQLSIEHAYQPWSDFWSVIWQARQGLGESALSLRCCFDPCNLLLVEPPESVAAIVAAMTPNDVSMIHLKQRKAGQIQPDLSAGDLDWHHLLSLLDHQGHRGPWLFEIAPHGDIWGNLMRSTNFVF